MTTPAVTPAATTSDATTTSDGRLEWIRAGEDVLREHGARGLKLAAVVAARGATTGSFYHHFANLGAYLDELVDHYARVDPQEAFALVADRPPVERLRALVALTSERDIARLDHAMRQWAASNERAAEAVRRLDEQFLTFLRQLFLDLGLPVEQAQVRAMLAFSASAAIVYPPWPITDEDADRAVELLTRR